MFIQHVGESIPGRTRVKREPSTTERIIEYLYDAPGEWFLVRNDTNRQSASSQAKRLRDHGAETACRLQPDRKTVFVYARIFR